MKRMTLGRYRVFSPNNVDVRSKHFNNIENAHAYYRSLSMGQTPLKRGTQLHLLDTQTGHTIDWGRFLEAEEDGDEVLRALMAEYDSDESNWQKVETPLPNGGIHVEWVHASTSDNEV